MARKPINKNPPPPIKSKTTVMIVIVVVDFLARKPKPRAEIDNQIVGQPDG